MVYSLSLVFDSFCLMFFFHFLPRISPKIPHTIYSSCPFRLLLVVKLSKIFFLIFLILTVLRSTGLVFCRILLPWNLMFFHDEIGVMDFGREITEQGANSITLYQGYMLLTWVVAIHVNLDCLAESFCQVSPLSVTFPHLVPFYSILFGSLCLSGGKLWSIVLRTESIRIIWNFVCTGSVFLIN